MAARFQSMPTSPLSVVIQHLMADRGSDARGMTDGELLARFLRSRDQDVLAALVRRHAAMVWGVCRRLLNHHDAEDAFQATFLVLVRKAADVPKQALANWLYGVARQTAMRVRSTVAKRRQREMQVMNMPELETSGQGRGVRGQKLNDWHVVLEEELSRLPDHYRGVIVLSDLEGLTRAEAARQLGIPEGSVASRLARARAMLAKRLARRGIVLSGGPVAAALSAGPAAAAPPSLVAATIKAANLLAAGAAGGISAAVAALTEGVIRARSVTRIKSVLTVALAVAALAGAAGLFYPAQAAPAPKPPWEEPALSIKEKAITKEDRLRLLIDNVLTAHGEEEKLNNLHSFWMTVKHSNGETQRYFVQTPKKLRWETTHRDRTGKRIVILFPEGRRWWSKEPNEDAKEFILTGLEFRVETWFDYVKFFGPRQVLRLKDPDHKVVLLDEEIKIGGRPAIGVEVTGPQFQGKMYFDKQTHLLVKGRGVSYREDIYSDHKMFDGIPIATKGDDGYFMPEVIDFQAVDKFNPKIFEQP
jgi:RNA polymerase sigma factor (sigma-70 family)